MTTITPRPLRPAYPHGPIEQVFDDIFFVRGTVELRDGMPCHLAMCFNRSMTIVRQGQDLILINSLRLSDEGLKELDALGKVKHVMKMGAFHGMDDPFYKERYGATVWAVEGTHYVSGFDLKTMIFFLEADKYVNAASTDLPIKKSKVFVFNSATPPDGVLILDRPEGKVLVTGDSLQNLETDPYANWLGKFFMWMGGFTRPNNVGPAWYKATKVDKAEVSKLLDLKFDHVLPTHGQPVVGQAWKKFKPSIEKLQ